MSGFGSEVQEHPFWYFGLLEKVVTGDGGTTVRNGPLYNMRVPTLETLSSGRKANQMVGSEGTIGTTVLVLNLRL